jgi:hypothetical protein
VVGGAVAGPPGALVGGALGAAGGAKAGDDLEGDADHDDAVVRKEEYTTRPA